MMADANALIQKRINAINKIVEKGCKDVIGKYIKETLIYYIYETFYKLGYGDEGDLANSIEIEVEYVGNGFIITVCFDDDKINHTSYYGSEKLGIKKGSNVYTVNWIDNGETYVIGSRSKRLKDIGKTPSFLEKTVESLNGNNNILNEFKSYLKKNGIDIN